MKSQLSRREERKNISVEVLIKEKLKYFAKKLKKYLPKTT
jgi:hypothetical protein